MNIVGCLSESHLNIALLNIALLLVLACLAGGIAGLLFEIMDNGISTDDLDIDITSTVTCAQSHERVAEKDGRARRGREPCANGKV